MNDPNNKYWTIRKPTPHMKKLCKALGTEYRIRVFDLERVIYRDFGNGYDVEISNVNTTSQRKKAVIYLWKEKNRIIKIIKDVPQDDIGMWVERLHTLTLSLKDTDFDAFGWLAGPRTEYASK